MNRRVKRALAWLPMLIAPVAILGPGLGCELIVNVDPMLADGSAEGAVIVPTTLDGYVCPICKDVSADADFDGDDGFPTSDPDAGEGGSQRDSAPRDGSTMDAMDRD
jgi:hypothetical protein